MEATGETGLPPIAPSSWGAGGSWTEERRRVDGGDRLLLPRAHRRLPLKAETDTTAVLPDLRRGPVATALRVFGELRTPVRHLND